MTKIYRAVVRGHFSDLNAAASAALIAVADEHTYFDSAFTTDGTFTYDERLVAFNLRYELRFVPDDPSDTTLASNPDTVTEQEVEAAAMERASGWLDGQGYGHKHLSVSVTDMATMWR